MMPYIYIAGPYTGKTHDHLSYYQIDSHIKQAEEAAARLSLAGVGFFCPHKHSEHFEVIVPAVPPSYWYELDIHFMRSCDAILMLPGWQDSKGSLEEWRLMEEWGRPVFYSIEEVLSWVQKNLPSAP